RVRRRFAEELHPNGTSAVTVDSGTGAVLRVEDARTAPLASRLLALRYPLHIGAWGGLPARLLALLTGLAPAALFLTGLFHWLARLRATAPVREPAALTCPPPGAPR
ncbi:MAG TPA: PepSY domain-containing protein, partial [Aggregicoccus sp.]|nr:PepSY domain-containing protein [Aggregicoccus sp.]